jgi:hypothetical protein
MVDTELIFNRLSAKRTSEAQKKKKCEKYERIFYFGRFSGLIIRIPGYRSKGPSSISGATSFLRSSVSGTGFTQPREYNQWANWKK